MSGHFPGSRSFPPAAAERTESPSPQQTSPKTPTTPPAPALTPVQVRTMKFAPPNALELGLGLPNGTPGVPVINVHHADSDEEDGTGSGGARSAERRDTLRTARKQLSKAQTILVENMQSIENGHLERARAGGASFESARRAGAPALQVTKRRERWRRNKWKIGGVTLLLTLVLVGSILGGVYGSGVLNT